jgi:hypothetical protein
MEKQDITMYSHRRHGVTYCTLVQREQNDKPLRQAASTYHERQILISIVACRIGECETANLKLGSPSLL